VPTCGKRFDVGGCMTFVDYFLEKLNGGKCPVCGTQVVFQVPERFQPELWERATKLSEIRAIVIEELDLSVRTGARLSKSASLLLVSCSIPPKPKSGRGSLFRIP
jgi:hypothetical protein